MYVARAFLALGTLLMMSTSHTAASADDPNLWLEDVTGDKALAWVREHNAVATKELADNARFKALDERLLAIYNADARIPYVEKMGAWYYNFWKDAQHERGVWRRTTLADYRHAEPHWETVLDLDALGKAETENWVWHGAQCLPPKYERCLLSLSRGGADANVTREFDIPSRAFVKDGFQLPEAKGSASWRTLDNVFVNTDFGAGSMTSSGYPRIVKQWQRGTPLEQATVVFEGKAEDVGVGAGRDHTIGFERDFIGRNMTFYTSEQYVMRDDKLVQIDVPADAQASAWREWLLVNLKSDWSVGGRTYPNGALIAIDYEAFFKGERKFQILFQPGARKSLAGYTGTRHHLVLNELDNVRNRLYVLTAKNGKWQRESMAGLPEFGALGIDAVDADESDEYFLTVTDFLTPTSLYFGTIGKGKPEKLKDMPAFFDAKHLKIAQHEAVSKDGTRIPYFEVSKTEIKLDGSNPTLLYGYGGFEVSLEPNYSGTSGAAWLERGGVYVLANIRGGGEFGPKWHQAALKENRHKAYEDFIAVAEDLIARKLTSTPHLGIMGGSNGGLLMGNMLTLRPDLFGAIVCQVGLLDMKRYSHLLAGASWMGEYGDPDDAEQWKFIKTFSPYHNVKKDVKYPRTLFTTSTRDDRVHPGHSRKMVARMIEQGHDVLYYENIEGGHGGSANNTQAAFMSALAYTFLWNQLK